MRVRNVGRHQEKVELMMTPMIDIVFQLLIFFIMTFKIIAPEGDFNIKMPLAISQGVPDESQLPPITVRLRATDDGRLAGVQLGEQPLAKLSQLRSEIRSIVGDDTGPGSIAETTEVELDCDYHLHFEHVIDAITYVSGYIVDGHVVKLIEKIKFAQARGG